MPYIPQMKTSIDLAIARVRQAIYTPVGELRIVAWVTSGPLWVPVPFASRKSGERKLRQLARFSSAASVGPIPVIPPGRWRSMRSAPINGLIYRMPGMSGFTE